LVVPFISGYFLFKKRKFIVEQRQYSFLAGSLIVLAGMAAWFFQMQSVISILHGSLSIKILSIGCGEAGVARAKSRV
jgi:hypothetical protein